MRGIFDATAQKDPHPPHRMRGLPAVRSGVLTLQRAVRSTIAGRLAQPAIRVALPGSCSSTATSRSMACSDRYGQNYRQPSSIVKR